ncbi:unnamed protein product [Peronospora belbahrii]|uniref:Uncharacterized protein n=1 Tax=Peronospora belbahrii TaxID=622444 RepID=A0AAU9KPL2_9STRA|nr:unnamed protein product [Peronospora belbahrii]
MGKEELLEALVHVQTTTSVDSLYAHFNIIHDALSDIHRKRWRFLEDACSVVLQQTLALVFLDGKSGHNGATDHQEVAMLTTKGIHLYLEFIEPLIHSTVSISSTMDNEEENACPRGVLVAALLHLFAKTAGLLGSQPLESRLVADVLRCGVDIHVILATLRFREELKECRRLLLPSYETDSEFEWEEGEEDDDDDEEEETRELAMEDIQWIVNRVVNEWGMAKYRLFLQMSEHEHAFSSWSYQGIGNFVHALLTDDQHKFNALPVLMSPFSFLFHVSAYAHYMICSENHQDRIRGLDLLRAASNLCPQEKLTIFVEKGIESMQDKPRSFRGQAASFRAREWLSPLIHVIANAMVSFCDAKERSAALEVLKTLIFKLVGDDRFRMLRSLIMKCPYANVSAILVDFVRGDAIQAWSSSDTSNKYPFKTTAICLLIQNVLSQTVERDLVSQADLLASCMSLVRFLYIRDKGNETGIRTESIICGIWDVLMCIDKRLQDATEATALYDTTETQLSSVERSRTHLMVLKAALDSTLELLSSTVFCGKT